MKISTFGYHIKQGFHNISRNKMMSIASVSTVMASLLIFGIFFITVVNVNFLMDKVESSVEIKVFLKDDISSGQMHIIESQVEKSPGVTEVIYESKEQALANFKEQLGDKGDLVAGINAEEVMPSSYIVKFQGPEYVGGVVDMLKTMEGIDKINDARSVLDKLMAISDFIRNLGLGLMAVLLFVSVFLISNTIKLTLLARRREIGIMKYIGATNWFIRWPFVIEGIVLGLLGALLSCGLLGYGYILASDAVTKNLIIVNIVEPMDILPYMGAIFLGVGFLIGSIGSAMSMRKFLKV